MRYVKPKAGRLARFSTSFITFGDYFGGFAATVVGMVSFIVGLWLGFAIAFWFFFLFTPALVVVTMHTLMHRHSIHRVNGDDRLRDALRILDKLRGEYAYVYALPMAEKIYEHVAAGKHSSYGTCQGRCSERLSAMYKLIPAAKDLNNDNDIQDALTFIEARKGLEA